ncbi:adenylosuccinate synthase [Hydrogenivirga sp. 128-5-R1-1]|uniref:adenylosuccinate synthase n=1 Tax=Hydrogenivirga sp. 128-5-R1-1 TaxID=392423 RepID=UPI00015F37DD|nr:adenylosuccinate synthase [Hydrogenivirga sp. 128-5-R1-1]EDP76642.1 adenylosuccinate synthetase [Hydrogenivirga sp. 128-5-R1-1]
MDRKLVILGAQWGDEGKGKIVDLLSENYDVTVRYQGGSNAGHTVIANGEKFILHLLPTGILHNHVVGVIAQGMVVDLDVLDRELEGLREKGIGYEGRLLVSDRAHLVMPYHKLLDRLFEKKSGIGTTLRGIGPAYMFKFGRKGIRLADLDDERRLYSLIEENVAFVKDICEKVFCENHDLDAGRIFEETLEKYSKYRGLVRDVSQYLLRTDKTLLFEGAQGTMLDVDMGTYPYVTSSNSSALGLSNGTGLSPKFFSDAYFVGVAKAYTTRVGGGPFPTELEGEEGKRLRDLGGEYGSTTGRPRRCGWLDLVALKYAVELNHFDGIILTKLDVLDTFDEIKVCVAYDYEGERLEHFPASLKVLESSRPVYETLRGWKRSTKGAKELKELPQGAKDYIRFIEEFTGVPVIMLSTGPRREEFVWLRELPQIKVSSL